MTEFKCKHQYERIAELQAKVAELEAERRWIPVSNPPTEFPHREIEILWFSDMYDGCHGINLHHTSYEITDPISTHWREIEPLPVPPAAEGEG